MIILKTIGQRAEYARNKLNLSPAQVAKLIPMSSQGYLDIESGKSQFPRHYIKISKILKIKPEWLIFGTGPAPYNDNDEIIVPEGFAPLLNWEDMCFLALEDDDEETLKEKLKDALKKTTKDKDKSIAMKTTGSINSFGLQIKDTNMISSIAGEDTFLPGDYIIIDPERKPQNKDFVVAIQEGTETPIFKQYLIDGKNIYLNSLSNKYPPILLTKKIKICGVVIEKYKSYY